MVSLRSIAASLVVPLLAVGLTSNGVAAPYKKRAEAGSARQAAMPRRSLAAHGYGGYYEQILDKVPFGSQRWWRIYEAQPKGR
ncbi:MAG TPA: hypothetical protein VLL28_09060 [Hyphomicrobiaceae bacterium]|nr:hypothetical protein [Hyphomicrobiaceae bacterium]